MTALVGTELLQVQGIAQNGMPSGQTFQTTTSAIAALAAATVLPPVVNTAITTAVGGTLTAAGIVGGLITRTGPTADFSDATDTAVAIVAALAAYVANESAYVKIKNATAFNETITAGAGVTLTGAVIIPANSVGTYLVTINSATTVTLLHVETGLRSTQVLEVTTALTTVGSGTITAAGITGKVTTRSGATTAFTDTTDTADNIIAAIPNGNIGASFEYTYINNTVAPATITGGTGVTVSGITTVGAGKTARYLVTYTAADTVTMVGILGGASTPGFLPNILKCTTQTDSITTAPANITGLTGQMLVAGATYKFRAVLPGTCDTTSGISYCFKYTTATLTSLESTGLSYTATACHAVKHVTSTTDQALLVDDTTVIILSVIEGTMVVNAGGTVALQVGTHTGTMTCSTYVGATMEFIRIS